MLAGAFRRGELGELDRRVRELGHDLVRAARQRVRLGRRNEGGARDPVEAAGDGVVGGGADVARHAVDAVDPEAPLVHRPVLEPIGPDELLHRPEDLVGYVREGGDHIVGDLEHLEAGEQTLPDAVQTGVGDARREARFIGRGAEHEVAAEAQTGKGDAVEIDVGASQHLVEHRRHHVLPVATHDDLLLDEHPALPRAVIDRAVVAAAHR